MQDFVGKCPHCGATNELVSQGADLEQVHCSACHKPLGVLFKLRQLMVEKQDKQVVSRKERSG